MTCPICNQKIDPSDHSEKWGPEFAHSRCVIAFTAGSAIQDAKLQDRIKRLEETAMMALHGCYNGPMPDHVRDALADAMEAKP